MNPESYLYEEKSCSLNYMSSLVHNLKSYKQN